MNALKAIKLIALASITAIACGCATKTRSLDLKGMYASETGTIAIGSVDISAAPEGQESATIKYSEDNAFLQPSMKLHNIKIMITGTNSVCHVTNIVHDITSAFVKVSPTTHTSTPQEDSQQAE